MKSAYGRNTPAVPVGIVPAFGNPVYGYWGKYMVGNNGRMRVRTCPTLDTEREAEISLRRFCARNGWKPIPPLPEIAQNPY